MSFSTLAEYAIPESSLYKRVESSQQTFIRIFFFFGLIRVKFLFYQSLKSISIDRFTGFHHV